MPMEEEKPQADMFAALGLSKQDMFMKHGS